MEKSWLECDKAGGTYTNIGLSPVKSLSLCSRADIQFYYNNKLLITTLSCSRMMVARPKCERTTKYILPTVRGLIAKNLVEEYGFSQSHAAKMLGITQAAVSQYISSKRGRRLTERLMANKKVTEMISLAAEKIADARNLKKVDLDICSICELVNTYME